MSPRRRPSSVPVRQIVTILMLVACMIGILFMKSRCGAAVGNLFNAIDNVPRDGGVSDGKTTP